MIPHTKVKPLCLVFLNLNIPCGLAIGKREDLNAKSGLGRVKKFYECQVYITKDQDHCCPNWIDSRILLWPLKRIRNQARRAVSLSESG